MRQSLSDNIFCFGQMCRNSNPNIARPPQFLTQNIAISLIFQMASLNLQIVIPNIGRPPNLLSQLQCQHSNSYPIYIGKPLKFVSLIQLNLPIAVPNIGKPVNLLNSYPKCISKTTQFVNSTIRRTFKLLSQIYWQDGTPSYVVLWTKLGVLRWQLSLVGGANNKKTLILCSKLLILCSFSKRSRDKT